MKKTRYAPQTMVNALADFTGATFCSGIGAPEVAAHWLWSIVERDECTRMTHRMSMEYWQLQVTK